MVRESATDEIVENRRRIENIQGSQISSVSPDDERIFDFFNERIELRTDIEITVDGNTEQQTIAIGTISGRELIISLLGGTNIEAVTKNEAGSGDQTDTTARREVTSLETPLSLSLSHTKTYDSTNKILTIESTATLSDDEINSISELAIKTDAGTIIQYIPVDISV